MDEATRGLISTCDVGPLDIVGLQYRMAWQLQQCLRACVEHDWELAALSMLRPAIDSTMKGLWWLFVGVNLSGVLNAHEELAKLKFAELISQVDSSMGFSIFEKLLRSRSNAGTILLKDILHPGSHGDALTTSLILLRSFVESDSSAMAEIAGAFDKLLDLFRTILLKEGFQISSEAGLTISRP